MTIENYRQYLIGTVESYPLKYKKYLRDNLEDAGIAQVIPQVSISNLAFNCVDVSEMEITNQITACLVGSSDAIKLYEKWEFIKDFKYSSIFEVPDFSQLLEIVKKIKSLEGIPENEQEHIYNRINEPVRMEVGDITLLKFNLNFSAIHPLSEDEKLLKYPVIIALHKKERLVEIRFDAIRRIFIPENKDQTIYADLIDDVLNYFNVELGCQLHPLEMVFMTRHDGEAKRVAQFTKLPSGGNAQLDVGNNGNYVLPILGELKELLGKHAVELEKSKVLKEALDQFLFENEELSEYSWIEMQWDNEVKIRAIRVKIIFSYRNKNYGLIQHYYNALVGMERMNHVTKYISEHRDVAKTTGGNG